MSKQTNEEIAAEIRSLKVSQKGKKKILIDRLEGKKTAYTKVVTQSAKRIAAEISKGELVVPKSAADVSAFAYALTSIITTTLPLDKLLGSLVSCKELAEAAESSSALAAVYKAACRVDELFFEKER